MVFVAWAFLISGLIDLDCGFVDWLRCVYGVLM